MTAWATPDQARLLWPGAPDDDQLLGVLLAAAETQCRAYAPLPVLVTDAQGVTSELVTDAMTLATTYQARELWAAGKREGDTIVQGDSYVLRARPLVGSVKQLLRPARGRKGIG